MKMATAISQKLKLQKLNSTTSKKIIMAHIMKLMAQIQKSLKLSGRTIRIKPTEQS